MATVRFETAEEDRLGQRVREQPGGPSLGDAVDRHRCLRRGSLANGLITLAGKRESKLRPGVHATPVLRPLRGKPGGPGWVEESEDLSRDRMPLLAAQIRPKSRRNHVSGEKSRERDCLPTP